MVHSAAIWNDVIEVETAEKKIKTRSLNCAFFRNLKMMFWKFKLLRRLYINRLPNGAFCLNLKRCKMRLRFIIIQCSGPDVIFKILFRVVYYIILWKWHTINNGTQESGSIVYLLKKLYKSWQNNLFVQLNQ